MHSSLVSNSFEFQFIRNIKSMRNHDREANRDWGRRRERDLVTSIDNSSLSILYPTFAFLLKLLRVKNGGSGKWAQGEEPNFLPFFPPSFTDWQPTHHIGAKTTRTSFRLYVCSRMNSKCALTSCQGILFYREEVSYVIQKNFVPGVKGCFNVLLDSKNQIYTLTSLCINVRADIFKTLFLQNCFQGRFFVSKSSKKFFVILICFNMLLSCFNAYAHSYVIQIKGKF